MSDDYTPSEDELLAPWYATRKLPRAEEEAVRARLQDDDFGRQLDLIEDERRGTVEVNERISAPSPASLDRLMEQIDGLPRRGPGLWARIGSAFAGFGLTGAPAATVMAGLAAAVLVQGGLLMRDPELSDAVAPAPVQPQQSATRSLTPDIPSSPSIVLVGFAEGANMAEVTALLERINGMIVSGPTSELYRISFASEREATAALQLLQDEDDLVIFTAPSE